MAVTQQLARLSPEKLQRCQLDVGVLMRVLRFDSLMSEAYLDLDWFPTYFLRYLAQVGDDDPCKDSFELAVCGQEVVNRHFPLHEVDEVPSVIFPSDVQRVSRNLTEQWAEAVTERLPVDLSAVNRLLQSDFDEHPAEYFRCQLSSLLSFYQAAAKGGEAVIVWWD